MLCQNQSSALKTVKEIEKLMGELSPNKPLKSVAFHGSDPPAIKWVTPATSLRRASLACARALKSSHTPHFATAPSNRRVTLVALPFDLFCQLSGVARRSHLASAPHPRSAYNFIVAGQLNVGDQLPANVGHINSTSANDIYDYFLERRNTNLVAEAEKLIAQMLSDVGKGAVPLISASSKKDAAVA